MITEALEFAVSATLVWSALFAVLTARVTAGVFGRDVLPRPAQALVSGGAVTPSGRVLRSLARATPELVSLLVFESIALVVAMSDDLARLESLLFRGHFVFAAAWLAYLIVRVRRRSRERASQSLANG